MKHRKIEISMKKGDQDVLCIPKKCFEDKILGSALEVTKKKYLDCRRNKLKDLVYMYFFFKKVTIASESEGEEFPGFKIVNRGSRSYRHIHPRSNEPE